MLGAVLDADELGHPDPVEGSAVVDDELDADVHADTNSPAITPRRINIRAERRWERISGMLLPPTKGGRSKPRPRSTTFTRGRLGELGRRVPAVWRRATDKFL